MRLRTRIVVVAAVAFAAGIPRQTAAQAPAATGQAAGMSRYMDPINGLSLSDAITRGLEREPDLLSVRAAVEVARGERRQATLRPNPMASIVRQDQWGGSDSQSGADVSWPLDLFRRAPRMAAADRAIDVADLGAADRRRLLTAEITSAYGEILVGIRVLEITDELIATLQRTYDLLGARVNEGASPALERNVSAVELRRAEAGRFAREAEVESDLLALKRLTGAHPGDELKMRETLEGALATLAVTVSARGRADAVVSERPDVRQARAEVDLAAARIRMAEAEGKFDLGLSGSYMRATTGFPQLGVGVSGQLEPIQGAFHNVALGLTIALPLRNRNQGTVAAARADRSRAQYAEQARLLEAESELATAMVRDRLASQSLGVFASGLRTVARQNLDVTRETYTIGAATLTDLLLEQRRYLEVELAHVEALKMAFDARTALVRAMGELR